MRPLSSYRAELWRRHRWERSKDCTVSKTGFESAPLFRRILTSQLECESSQNYSNQLKAVTKTAIAHDPMPHASPTTTTMIALPVSFGLSSNVRNRSNAPIPKITKARVWLVPLSSATTAPTTPRSISALRSSRSASGSASEARRGCHAIAYAQPTARLRLRKSRRMNSGCPNCSTLYWIDTHELPLGSIPPVDPALANSSAGLAPIAAEDKTLKMPMTAMTLTLRSAHPRWRSEQKRRAGILYGFLTK